MPSQLGVTHRRRWWFLRATINYMDRQVIALLKPTLQSELGWSEIGYNNIVFVCG